MKFETRLLTCDPAPGDRSRPANTPIYQTATFRQDSATEFGEYDYSRSGNPTRAVLEKQLAQMESGSAAYCYSSGLAAITAVTRLLKPGERIVACNDLYGGTYRLFSRILGNRGVEVQYADMSGEAPLAGARLVYLETPTNPLFRALDIARIAERAHAAGALVCVDNSTMSPWLQRPLELGADIVLHSATKFLCGHSDTMAGAVVVRDAELARALYLIQNGEGAALAPFDSFLVLRGVKTLALRMRQQQENAAELARYLAGHPRVTAILHPEYADEAERSIHRRQASGAGAVFSFRTGDAELSRRAVEACRLFQIAVSFGSVQSTISLPFFMSHASIPEQLRGEKQLPRDLVRVSAGIEAAEDLMADLEQALAAGERAG